MEDSSGAQYSATAEKRGTITMEKVPRLNQDQLNNSQAGSTNHVHFDQAATKKMLRKMDLRLVPFFALLYL
jgi:hypothetical protein